MRLIIELGPAVCGVMYALSALAFLREGNPWWALVYAAYSIANVGLIMAARGTA